MKIYITLILLYILSIQVVFTQVSRSSDTEGTPPVMVFDTLGQQFIITPPRLLQKGETLTIDSDDMYLINKDRYKFYRSLHLFIRDKANPLILRDYIGKYEDALKINSETLDSLVVLHTHTDSLLNDAYQFSKENLTAVQKSQEAIQGELTQVNADLEATKKYINKSKFWTKFTIFGAALGGFLIGAFVN